MIPAVRRCSVIFFLLLLYYARLIDVATTAMYMITIGDFNERFTVVQHRRINKSQKIYFSRSVWPDGFCVIQQRVVIRHRGRPLHGKAAARASDIDIVRTYNQGWVLTCWRVNSWFLLFNSTIVASNITSTWLINFIFRLFRYTNGVTFDLKYKK